MIAVQPSSNAASHLLKTSLLANAIFSALSGLSFVIGAKQIATALGWFSPWLLIGIGLGLLGFSGVVARAAMSQNITMIKTIILMDIAWVIASGLLLLSPWINSRMIWVIALAVLIAVLALLQFQGLQKLESNSFGVSTFIDAPVNQVWRVLADVGTIAQWHPGVKASHRLSEHDALGASRHCDLGKNNYLDEEVILWDVEKRLTMRITKTNLPMTADIHFYLAAKDKGTHVVVKPVYQVKYGILGLILDTFYVRRTYTKGMQALLGGLKKYTEAQVS
jgi:uncharacterized protein YndB with AHSA1/START domain